MYFEDERTFGFETVSLTLTVTKSCLPFFQNLKKSPLAAQFFYNTDTSLRFSLLHHCFYKVRFSLSLSVFYFTSNLLIICLFNVKILTFTEKTNKHHNYEV